MKKTHLAIKIDSVRCTCSLIQIAGLEDLQAAVEGYIEGAIRFGRPHSNHILYVNDDALNMPVERGFWFHGAYQPYLGNGIVCGGDSNGNTRDCKMSLEEVQSRVVFTDRSTLALCSDLGGLDSYRARMYSSMRPVGSVEIY